jgi:hypothetical protein
MKLHKVLFSLVLSVAAVSAGAQTDSYDVFNLPGGKTLMVPSFRTYVASGYKPSEKNIEFLKGLKEKVTAPKLLAFDLTKNNKDMMLCRASFPVYAPNKTSFAAFVEAAINMELVASGLVEPEAPRLPATLNEFEFSSFGGGKWTIDVSATPENKPALNVKNVYEYSVSFTAGKGCADVMQALPMGVESFLMKLYSDPGFVALMQ